MNAPKGRAGKAYSPFDELEQVGVHFVGIHNRDAVGAAGIDLQYRVRNDLWHSLAGRFDGNDLVVFTVDDEQRNVALGYVLGVVNLPAVCRVVLSPGASQQTLEPEQVTHPLRGSRALSVGTEKGFGQTLEKGRPILCHSG